MFLRAMLAAAFLLCTSGCGTEAEPTAASTASTTTSTGPTTATRATPAEPHPSKLAQAYRAMRRLSDERAETDPRLSELASRLVGYEATVRCWDERGWQRLVAQANAPLPPSERTEFDGITDLYAARIDLAPWICEAIAKIPRDVDSVDELDLAAALGIFVHETRHLTSAGSNEVVAECDALQKLDTAGELLGLSRERAQRLAYLAWAELYPMLPAAYRSTECRPGGSLDHEPETREFP